MSKDWISFFLYFGIILTSCHSGLNVEGNLHFASIPELEFSPESLQGELSIDAEYGAELFWNGFHLSHKRGEDSNETSPPLFLLAVLDESTVVHHIPVFYLEHNIIEGKLQVLLSQGNHSLVLVLSRSKELADFIGISSDGLILSTGPPDYDQLLETLSPFEPFLFETVLDEDRISDIEEQETKSRFYTTHVCVGDTHQSTNVSDGMCLFKNLCIMKGRFTYFMNPELSDQTVPKVHTIGRRHKWEPREIFSFAVRLERIPSWLFPFDTRLHFYVRRFHQYNFGHILGDDCWPIFQGMCQFDLIDYDNQIIIDDDFDDQHGSAYPSNKMFLSVSKNPVKGIRAYQGADVCFENFITGFGRYGYGSGSGNELEVREPAWGKGKLFRLWRSFVWSELDVSASWQLKAPAFRITLIQKDVTRASHKFAIINGPELMDSLRKMYPVARVQNVSWSRMSMRDTLLVMRNSDVVVSLPGSDVMRGIFLPDGALVILPCRRGPSTIAYIEIDGWQPYSPEAILWLRHLPYIQVAEYCGHRPENVDPAGVRIDPADLQPYISDWLLRRPLIRSRLPAATPNVWETG